MAINIFALYGPLRAGAPTVDYPVGFIKNESVPGANDGTPLDQTWANDYAGFDAALFTEVGLTPDGNADTSQSSQRLEAIKLLSQREAVTGRPLNEIINDDKIKEGQSVVVSDRSGAIFDIVTGQTPNGMDIIQSIVTPSLFLKLRVEGWVNAKALGAKAFDNTFDNGPMMSRSHELNAVNDGNIAWPLGKFFFSTNVPLYLSDTWFGGFAPVMKGWGTDGGVTQFVWNGAPGGDGITVAGISGSKVDPSLNYNIVENLTPENFAVYPETDFQMNHGIEFDGSAVTPQSGYIRNITMNNVSVEKCNSHNIVARGDVFDVKGYNITSRISNGACFRGVAATVNAGLRSEPDQINLFNPVLFALKQAGTVTNTDAWAVNGSGIVLHGGNLQGSLAFRMGFGCGIFGTHVEHEEAGPDGSIGILVRGSWNQIFPKWIVGYKFPFQMGESDSANIEGVGGHIPLVDCKSISGSTAALITPNGARNGDVTFGEIKDTDNVLSDNRGLAEFLMRYKNKVLLQARTLTPNSSTPSVSKGTKFITANTVATTLTDFLDGFDEEEISVRFEDNNTTIQIVGNPRFDSSAKVDITPVAFSVYRFQRDDNGNRWIVIGQ